MCILNYQQHLIGETVNMLKTIYLYLQISHNVRTGFKTEIWETSINVFLALHNVKWQQHELQNGLTEHGIYESELIKSSQYNNLLIKIPISHYMSQQISGTFREVHKVIKILHLKQTQTLQQFWFCPSCFILLNVRQGEWIYHVNSASSSYLV